MNINKDFNCPSFVIQRVVCLWSWPYGSMTVSVFTSVGSPTAVSFTWLAGVQQRNKEVTMKMFSQHFTQNFLSAQSKSFNHKPAWGIWTPLVISKKSLPSLFLCLSLTHHVCKTFYSHNMHIQSSCTFMLMTCRHNQSPASLNMICHCALQ